MYQNYRDYLEGSFITTIDLKKQPNGNYKASSMGLEVEHEDATEATNRLQDKLQAEMTAGTLTPKAI